MGIGSWHANRVIIAVLRRFAYICWYEIHGPCEAPSVRSQNLCDMWNVLRRVVTECPMSGDTWNPFPVHGIVSEFTKGTEKNIKWKSCNYVRRWFLCVYIYVFVNNVLSLWFNIQVWRYRVEMFGKVFYVIYMCFY